MATRVRRMSRAEIHLWPAGPRGLQAASATGHHGGVSTGVAAEHALQFGTWAVIVSTPVGMAARGVACLPAADQVRSAAVRTVGLVCALSSFFAFGAAEWVGVFVGLRRRDGSADPGPTVTATLVSGCLGAIGWG